MGVAQLEETEQHRLTPAMRSRKLQALDFIKRYFAQWGQSPSLGELGAFLDVSTKRAHDLVDQLAREEMIQRETGKTRGIRLIERGEELSEADVLLRLSAMGWTIGQGFRVILPPEDAATGAACGAAIMRGLMEKGLPELDYIPDEDLDTETGTNGEISETGDGARAAASARGAAGGD